MRTPFLAVAALAASFLLSTSAASASVVWIEGEKPSKSSMNRHPWWYDKFQKDKVSGGDLVSNFSKEKPGEAEYRFNAPTAGEYVLWVRANPVKSQLSWQLNGGAWTKLDFEAAIDRVNIAPDNALDLRFLAWVRAGSTTLKKGANTVAFRMDGTESNHGYLDCFVFTDEPFEPRGKEKPGRRGAAGKADAELNKDWYAFDPPADPFRGDAGFDLRSLNEKEAGDGGHIAAKGSDFVHSKTGETVRFWAVNGPAARDVDTLKREARLLAKHGVNLARIHHGYFNENGEVRQEDVKRTLDAVPILKAEGIYTHLSIYFPLWLNPKAGLSWLEGYDGSKHPFAALMFNRDFQNQYRKWWTALLTTPMANGRTLVEDPAVMGLEVQNEDSFFFWTFNANGIPDSQMRMIEKQFGDWLVKKYGSIEAVQQRWGGRAEPRDAPAEGRFAFRAHWNAFTEKRPRDQDAARFLAETQREFYADTIKFLRGLGFKGVVTASNWVTSNPQVYGPLEKYTYTVGDFVDRHGYFSCRHQGENSAWSVRDGHTYIERSALRFDPEESGKPKQFVHPAMNVGYDDKPTMISETTFNRPNRYRSEAPLYYAVYGALQNDGAIVHFAQDATRWAVKPGYFMQPWTLMSPAMMGQFPAAALIYRKGLVKTGDVMVDLDLKLDDLFQLKGSPLPQDAAFDELRLKDVPQGTELQPGKVIDPLVHYVGRTRTRFSEAGAAPKLVDLREYIDHKAQRVKSVTGELVLDYDNGVLTIDAPAAQGASGYLKANAVKLRDLAIASDMSLAHVVAVSLDDQPLATSKKILLQAMSEEKSSGFQTEKISDGRKKIVSIGHDPWLVRKLRGTVSFLRSDAGTLTVTALDANGYIGKKVGDASKIELLPEVNYYLIAP